MNKITIFDTTLRDGEQSPGAAMTPDQKLKIATQLQRLGVDVIEAGFAAASPGDAKAINQIAQNIKNCTICSLARANPKDIEIAAKAVEPAQKPRIHTFIATSKIHMDKKLKLSPDEVVNKAVQAVKLAKSFCNDVEFSAEDATRSDIDFLIKIVCEAVNAGATTINLPDTVGYALPIQIKQMFETIKDKINDPSIILSTHCHDDLGLAVANSITAIQAGARQIECTINGLGERAGNAALEEVVMAIKTRNDQLKFDVSINSTLLVPVSKLVCGVTGYPVQPNKAIVGANAFSHQSGIHQDGVLKHRETYEIMSAESVGWENNKITLGKLSGRNAFKNRLLELGINPTDEELEHLFSNFKKLADIKKKYSTRIFIR